MREKILADFVGKRINDTPQWEFKFCDGFWPRIETMKFDSSFDWIIPVVRKAKDVHYKVAGGPQLYRKIELELLKLDIKKVVSACITFIETYNKQKK